MQWGGHEIDMTWGHRYKKTRDIQIVDTYVRIAPCEFQRVWIFDVSLTGSQSLKNATWGQVT